MDYATLMQNTAVLGAAGKMGTGITALVVEEMSRLALIEKRWKGHLVLIDANRASFPGLLAYLKKQLTNYAEKQIVALRRAYADRSDLVDNSEIIEGFVEDALGMIETGATVELAAGSALVFEAVIEHRPLKQKLLSTLAPLCPPETVFLTNTSSIPVTAVASAAAKLALPRPGCSPRSWLPCVAFSPSPSSAVPCSVPRFRRRLRRVSAKCSP